MKYLLSVLCLFFVITLSAQTETTYTPNQLAQLQLDAYNSRNIEGFLAPYAEDVKIYTFPNELIMEGKEAMRKSYGAMFQKTKNLHCSLVNRVVMGDTVIDKEYVVGFGEDAVEVIAIYKIKEGKIAEVYFIR